MTIFDLLLILLVLGTVCSFTILTVAVFRGKSKTARLVGGSLLLAWCAYLVAGAVVALMTPQRRLTMGEDRCFDEMCFAVTAVDRLPAIDNAGEKIKPTGVFYVVTVRSSSHSRGRPQRESGIIATLLDTEAHRYQVSAELTKALNAGEAGSASIDSTLQPSQSLVSKLVFDVPANLHNPGLVFDHSYKLNPALIIIGDDQHFLHRHAIIQLDR